jgi:hypothetical protein
LTGIMADDEQLYISLRQLCDSLSLDIDGQTQRIRRTEAMSEGLQRLPVLAPDGRRHPAVCLRVDLIPGWLSGLSLSRVKNETLRAKLVAYQRDLYRVAWQVFGESRASVMPAPQVNAMAQDMAGLIARMESIDEAISALYDLLGKQSQATKAISVLIEGVQSELTNLRAEVGSLETRTKDAFMVASQKLKNIDMKLNPGDKITDEQAARLKEGVNHIASEMRKRGTKNPYPEIWGAFDHYFNVPEYRSLPQGRFSEALDWLTRWETDLSGGSSSEE